jgi:hypothetical protein
VATKTIEITIIVATKSFSIVTHLCRSFSKANRKFLLATHKALKMTVEWRFDKNAYICIDITKGPSIPIWMAYLPFCTFAPTCTSGRFNFHSDDTSCERLSREKETLVSCMTVHPVKSSRLITYGFAFIKEHTHVVFVVFFSSSDNLHIKWWRLELGGRSRRCPDRDFVG